MIFKNNFRKFFQKYLNKDFLLSKFKNFLSFLSIEKKNKKQLDNKFIFLAEEISEIDKTFSQYKLYSASIHYCIKNSEKINIENIKNRLNNLKNFNCTIYEKSNKIEVVIVRK